MKKIWIDGYEANVSQRLGSGQVAYELLKNIEELDYKNDYTILLPSKPLSDLPPEREGFRYKILKPDKLWTRIALPLKLFSSRQKPDVMFTPTHYIPRFVPTGVKKVVAIFDLSYLHYPQMFLKKDLYKLTNWSKYSIQNSEQIITISNASKKDIVKNYNIPSDRVSVCYPGYNSKKFHQILDKELIEEVKDKFLVKGEYIIFVGTVQPRKNIERLIRAVAKINNLSLVVVGKIKGEGRQAWMSDEILKLPKELNIEERIIFTGFVKDEEMVALVNGAKAFVLPSLWEGFGIPVVDAMACGIPVIVSNISSLPEVVGDAGLLVDPTSIDQIEQAIRTISTDQKLWQKLSKQSLEQSKKFSWSKMAKDVIKVLEAS